VTKFWLLMDIAYSFAVFQLGALGEIDCRESSGILTVGCTSLEFRVDIRRSLRPPLPVWFGVVMLSSVDIREQVPAA
jgi:hypothetical protein